MTDILDPRGTITISSLVEKRRVRVEVQAAGTRTWVEMDIATAITVAAQIDDAVMMAGSGGIHVVPKAEVLPTHRPWWQFWRK